MTPRHPVRSVSLAAVAAAAVVGVVLAENLFAGLLVEFLLHRPGIDKVLHWVQYLAVFLVLWWAAGALACRPWRRVALAAAAALAVGVLDEAVQRQMAQRIFELPDLAVDAAAVAAGAALVAPLRRRAATAAVVAASLAIMAGFAYRTHLRLRHYNRAILYERQHDLRGARREYLASIAAGHATPSVYNSLAWAEIESGIGDPAVALRYAERGIAARPDDADFLDTYGWALHHVGRPQEALPVLERARAGKPEMYCIDYHLGSVLRTLGRACDARRLFERQIARFPDTSEAARARHELATVACAAPAS